MDIIKEFEFNDGELESIEKIKLHKDGIVTIEYTITDEYKEKHQLYYKHRIIKIDNNVNLDALKITSYANAREAFRN